VTSDATSDVTLFLILSVCRRTSEAERYARAGKWSPSTHPEEFLGVDPKGKTLGIVGLGRIGKEVARKAQAFSMKIIYYNRNRDEKYEKENHIQYMEFDQLLATADVITIHTPLSPSTKHLIDRPQFSMMKKGAFFINTSRGPVVNEDALVEALETGHLRGAGLDVHENTPTIHPKLMSRNNVTLLPHIGSCTRETRSNMWRLCIENAASILYGKGPLTPVNKVNPQ